ncbi:MAG TPA: class I SAM-dependent methyltransferase [Terriglobales bacterium]|nr:class I SAM-dependent methyltransferase [Terriglobales bacterium]
MASASQIRDHYDSLAFLYQAFWGDHIHHGLFLADESPATAQVQMLDHCVGLLGLRGGEQVLDAGCGHGGTLLHLAGRWNCRGTGLTLSPKQAEIAHEKAAKTGFDRQVEFLVSDVTLFAFPPDAFDLVWAMESSEHFPDKPKFFADVKHTLHSQGQLLLAAWTGPMKSSAVREVARAFLCPELWTAAEYAQAIEAVGLEVAHQEDLSVKVIRTWEICRQRARAAGALVRLLPQATQEFVAGIDVILEAYRSGDLTYTVLVARK